jgi:phosphoglycolate phosphatase-like HAD superfamily hydrolase
MRPIKAVLIEPVGCLAEFPAEEFNEIAGSLFESGGPSGLTGSEAYWQLLDLMEQTGDAVTPSNAAIAEELELQAIDRVHLYEDVAPALAALKAMDIRLLIASSLSAPAVNRFLEKFSLAPYFSAVWTRDNAGGVKAAPLRKAIESIAVKPEHVMCLVDTAESIELANSVGVNSILMIDDPDEGRRLAMLGPTGGIVSLHELPDAVKGGPLQSAKATEDPREFFGKGGQVAPAFHVDGARPRIHSRPPSSTTWKNEFSAGLRSIRAAP